MDEILKLMTQVVAQGSTSSNKIVMANQNEKLKKENELLRGDFTKSGEVLKAENTALLTNKLKLERP